MDRAQEHRGALGPASAWGWRSVAPYLAVVGVMAVALGLYALRYGYHGSFLLLNAATAPLAPLYRVLTQAGDSLIAGGGLVLLLLLLPGPRTRAERLALVIVGVAALLLTGVAVQLLKRQVFGEWHRPMGVFEGALDITYADVEGGRYFSFPSGHAKTLVCVGLVLAFALRPLAQLGLGLVVALLAYGRVAVGMHYPLDLVGGAVVAVALTLPLIALLAPRLSRWFEGRSEWALVRWRVSLLSLGALALATGLVLRFAKLFF